jgi:hypothetical protein
MKLFILWNILATIYSLSKINVLHQTEQFAIIRSVWKKKYLTFILTYNPNIVKMHMIFLANLFYYSHPSIHSCNFHSFIPSYNCLSNNIKDYPVWFELFCRPLNSPEIFIETPCHIFCPSYLMHMSLEECCLICWS